MHIVCDFAVSVLLLHQDLLPPLVFSVVTVLLHCVLYFLIKDKEAILQQQVGSHKEEQQEILVNETEQN
jgi:hypothetical protein